MYELRIVSMDKILLFINAFIIIINLVIERSDELCFTGTVAFKTTTTTTNKQTKIKNKVHDTFEESPSSYSSECQK